MDKCVCMIYSTIWTEGQRNEDGNGALSKNQILVLLVWITINGSCRREKKGVHIGPFLQLLSLDTAIFFYQNYQYVLIAQEIREKKD